MKRVDSAIAELSANLKREGYIRMASSSVGDFIALNFTCRSCGRKVGKFLLFRKTHGTERRAYVICKRCCTFVSLRSEKTLTRALIDFAIADTPVTDMKVSIDEYIPYD